MAVVGVLVLAVGGFFLVRSLLPGDDGPLAGAGGGASPGVTDAYTDTEAGTESDPSDADNSASANEGQFTAADCPAPVQESRRPLVPEDASASENRKWHATLKTCVGDIEAELDGVSAPNAVAVFVELVRTGYHDGTGCHELKTAGPRPCLKCGDPTFSGTGSPGFVFGPPENVPPDGVYPAGSLVMAFNAEGLSSAQFSLLYEDLELPGDEGHTVFGKVTKGMEILESGRASRGAMATGNRCSR